MLIETKNSFYSLEGSYLAKVTATGEPLELPMQLKRIHILKEGKPMLVVLKDGKIFRTSEVQKVTFP